MRSSSYRVASHSVPQFVFARLLPSLTFHVRGRDAVELGPAGQAERVQLGPGRHPRRGAGTVAGPLGQLFLPGLHQKTAFAFSPRHNDAGRVCWGRRQAEQVKGGSVRPESGDAFPQRRRQAGLRPATGSHSLARQAHGQGAVPEMPVVVLVGGASRMPAA